MEYLDLLEALATIMKDYFMPDAAGKARSLLQHMGSVGAYSSNSGVEQIRVSVANFISIRDGYSSHPDDIFLTCGAFEGMLTALTLIGGGSMRNERTGVILPVPYYLVYLALLSTLDLEPIPYHLKEHEAWNLPSKDEFNKIILDSKSRGVMPRCAIVINPSNPTGAVYGKSALETLMDVVA